MVFAPPTQMNRYLSGLKKNIDVITFWKVFLKHDDIKVVNWYDHLEWSIRDLIPFYFIYFIEWVCRWTEHQSHHCRTSTAGAAHLFSGSILYMVEVQNHVCDRRRFGTGLMLLLLLRGGFVDGWCRQRVVVVQVRQADDGTIFYLFVRRRRPQQQLLPSFPQPRLVARVQPIAVPYELYHQLIVFRVANVRVFVAVGNRTM